MLCGSHGGSGSSCLVASFMWTCGVASCLAESSACVSPLMMWSCLSHLFGKDESGSLSLHFEERKLVGHVSEDDCVNRGCI